MTQSNKNIEIIHYTKELNLFQKQLYLKPYDPFLILWQKTDGLSEKIQKLSQTAHLFGAVWEQLD